MRIQDPTIAPYCIDIDESGSGFAVTELIVITREGSKGLGNTRERFVGHYTNFGPAVIKIAHLLALSNPIEKITLQQYVERVEDSNAKILAAIKI